MCYIIYQTSFIGDIILATSLITSIRELDPSATVIMITTPAGAALLANNPDIGAIIIYDKRGAHRGLRGLLAIRTAIASIVGSDGVVYISPHRFLRGALLGALTGASVRAGFNCGLHSLLYTHRVDYAAGVHEIQRNHRLLASVFKARAVLISPKPPRLFPSPRDLQRASDLIPREWRDRMIVAIAPGSVWPTKRWPLRYFAELIGLMRDRGLCMVLIGGDADKDLCAALEGDSTINLAGKTTLLESAAAIGMCRALVTNDSAPLHMASALDVPTIAIFGATVPAQGFGPLAQHSIVIEQTSIDCRPCGRHGGKTCSRGDFYCMMSLSPGAVCKALDDTAILAIKNLT